MKEIFTKGNIWARCLRVISVISFLLLAMIGCQASQSYDGMNTDQALFYMILGVIAFILVNCMAEVISLLDKISKRGE